MEDDLHISDLREVEAISDELEPPLFGLGIRKTVIPALPLEPRVAGFLPCFYAPEKRFEGKIHSNLNVLEDLSIDLLQFRPIPLPLCQDLVCLIEGDRTLLLFPGVLSQCERIIIDPPANLKRLLKERDLRFGRIDSVTICPTHCNIILTFA